MYATSKLWERSVRTDVMWQLMALYIVGFTALSLESGRRIHPPPMPSVNRAGPALAFGGDAGGPALPMVVTPGARATVIVASVPARTVTR